MASLFLNLLGLCLFVTLTQSQIPLEAKILDPTIDLDMININLSSMLTEYSDFRAHSSKIVDEVPVVYLPIIVAIDVDLSRSKPVRKRN